VGAAGRRDGVPGRAEVRRRRRAHRTAAAKYQQIKAEYYVDQPNFVPLIVEMGGSIGSAGLWFMDTLTGVLSPGRRTPGRLSAVELARKRKRASVCDAVRALTKHQAFMLAQIVEEIHAGCRWWGWCG
jgi:hypothetical protein